MKTLILIADKVELDVFLKKGRNGKTRSIVIHQNNIGINEKNIYRLGDGKINKSLIVGHIGVNCENLEKDLKRLTVDKLGFKIFKHWLDGFSNFVNIGTCGYRDTGGPIVPYMRTEVFKNTSGRISHNDLIDRLYENNLLMSSDVIVKSIADIEKMKNGKLREYGDMEYKKLLKFFFDLATMWSTIQFVKIPSDRIPLEPDPLWESNRDLAIKELNKKIEIAMKDYVNKLFDDEERLYRLLGGI